ncbi:MAG: alpha/beta fold hydrolase [Pirellulales bacterium]
MSKPVALFLGPAIATISALMGTDSAEAQGPHQRLMHYLDDAGQEQPVTTPADWQRRRVQILAGMQQVMGPLPAEIANVVEGRAQPAPLDVQVVETADQDGIPRQTVSLASRNGERVTAYVWTPKIPAGEKRAAILALHPTGDLGKGITAGYGKENRGYGVELAKRGYVVIAPDYVSFGDQKSHDFAKDDYVSGTMKAIVDHIRCVDYLDSREDVDGEQIGVIGHSLGGHNALFVAAFDLRIKAIVSSCGWDPFHHYYDGKKLANWAQPRYMPWVVEKFGADPDRMPFDFYEVVAALAPRPFFTNSPQGDGNFQYKGVKKGVAAAREVYDLLKADIALQARYPNCGHDFPNAQRREAYTFLDAALKHKSGGTLPGYDAIGVRSLVEIKSTLDGTMQPSYVIVPEAYTPEQGAKGILVNVHSWSGDLNQRTPDLEVGANLLNLIYIAPNFRGPNKQPEACGSKLAQQDVLDAVDYVLKTYKVAPDQVFLTGSSGGGHMTMQLVGNHPQRWTAASAWVGISDVAAWHKLHFRDNYGAMLRASCGGAPGDNAAVDAEYRFRSPKTHLAAAVDVPLDIAAGIYDGHHGSVPVRHSLEAFNVVAAANEARAKSSDTSAAGSSQVIDEATIAKLCAAPWSASYTGPDAEQHDPSYDRTIYFRRESGNCRITLFEGGHERLDRTALEWLMKHLK